MRFSYDSTVYLFIFAFSYGKIKPCSGENITQKQIYHFDDHGNLNKIIQVNAAGEETVMGEYEYKLYTIKVK